MVDYFKRLYRYNQWANEQFLEFLLAPGHTYDLEEIQLFSHVINSESLWLGRILSDRELMRGPWLVHPEELLRPLSSEISEAWFQYMKGLKKTTNLEEGIQYTNTQGMSYTSPLADILAQVVNHSTYHRAQLARSFVKRGHPAPVTDFIHYSRTVLGEV